MSSFGLSPRSGASPSRTDGTAHVAESPQSADRPFGGAYSMHHRWEGDVVRLARKSSVPQGDAVGQQPVGWGVNHPGGGSPNRSRAAAAKLPLGRPVPCSNLDKGGVQSASVDCPHRANGPTASLNTILPCGVPRSQGPQRDFFRKDGENWKSIGRSGSPRPRSTALVARRTQQRQGEGTFSARSLPPAGRAAAGSFTPGYRA